MHRLTRGIAALFCSALLFGCGGGGGGGGPPADPISPPPPPPAKASLNAINYRNVLMLSFGSSISAFTYVRLGVDGLENLFLLSPIFPLSPAIPFPCGESGTVVREFDDRDGNRLLSVNDSALIVWEDCRGAESMTDGFLRVNVDSITDIPDGRDLMLTVTVVDLTHTRFSPASSTTINFIAPVRYTHTSTYKHFVVASGIFTTDHTIFEDNLSLLVIDYLQSYDTSTYNLVVQGEVDSDAIGGKFEFTTPLALTGALGEFPSAGHLSVLGGANTTARLAEEGVAATDPAIVLIAVDTNGDGMNDTTVPDLPWSNIAPQSIFARWPDGNFVTHPPF